MVVPGDEGAFGVETVEAERELELLVEQDEYLDALLLRTDHNFIS